MIFLDKTKRYVYNKSDLGSESSNLQMDTTRTAAIGLGGKSTFKVWTRVVGSGSGGKSHVNRNFNQTSTGGWGYPNNSADLKIICIE